MTISQAREKFNISTPMVIDIGAYNEDTAALIKQRLAQGQPISPALLHSANQQALQPYIAPQAPVIWPLANQQGIQPYTSAVAPQPQAARNVPSILDQYQPLQNVEASVVPERITPGEYHLVQQYIKQQCPGHDLDVTAAKKRLRAREKAIADKKAMIEELENQIQEEEEVHRIMGSFDKMLVNAYKRLKAPSSKMKVVPK